MTTAANRSVWVHKGWPVEKLEQRAMEHLDKAFRGDRTLSRDGEVVVWLLRQVAEMRDLLATHVVLHPTNDAERLQDAYTENVNRGNSGLSMVGALTEIWHGGHYGDGCRCPELVKEAFRGSLRKGPVLEPGSLTIGFDYPATTKKDQGV